MMNPKSKRAGLTQISQNNRGLAMKITLHYLNLNILSILNREITLNLLRNGVPLRVLVLCMRILIRSHTPTSVEGVR